MKPLPDPVRGVLFLAADLIRRQGNLKGGYGNVDIGYCVSGAILEVSEGNLVDLFDARSRVCLEIGNDFLFCWNDAEERTKEDAITALERAALR